MEIGGVQLSRWGVQARQCYDTVVWESEGGIPDSFPTANHGICWVTQPCSALLCCLSVCLSVVFTFTLCLFSAHISHTHVGKLAVMRRDWGQIVYRYFLLSYADQRRAGGRVGQGRAGLGWLGLAWVGFTGLWRSGGEEVHFCRFEIDGLESESE